MYNIVYSIYIYIPMLTYYTLKSIIRVIEEDIDLYYNKIFIIYTRF